MFFKFPYSMLGFFLIFSMFCFTFRTVADLMPLHLHSILSETLLALSFSHLNFPSVCTRIFIVILKQHCPLINILGIVWKRREIILLKAY